MNTNKIVAVCTLILILASIMCACNTGTGSSTCTEGKVAIEVDHQSGMQPFGPWGPSGVANIFPTSAKPGFEVDQNDLQDSMIPIRDWESYWWANSRSDSKYWLCGIKAFADSGGNSIDTVIGRTHMDRLYRTYSYVCYDVAALYSDPGKMRLKTCCHELGHQVAWLTHLCTDFGSWNDYDHHDVSCLMGQGAVSTCTGANLLDYIHFCDSCKLRLCRATGVEEDSCL